MNTAIRARITQFHFQFQNALLPLLDGDFGGRLIPALQRVVRTLECIEIERFVPGQSGEVSSSHSCCSEHIGDYVITYSYPIFWDE